MKTEQTQEVNPLKLKTLFIGQEDRLTKLLKQSGGYTVDKIMESTEAPRTEVIELMHALENAGAGKFITGRRGHPSRFEWSTKPQDLAEQLKIAKPDLKSNPPTSLETVKRGRGRPKGSKNRVKVVAATHEKPFKQSFYLRPDFQVKLTLPHTLSKVEASKICDFVHLLVIEEK